jgi:hypothetical protein
MQRREEPAFLGKIVETVTNLFRITDLNENILWRNAALGRSFAHG